MHIEDEIVSVQFVLCVLYSSAQRNSKYDSVTRKWFEISNFTDICSSLLQLAIQQGQDDYWQYISKTIVAWKSRKQNTNRANSLYVILS